MKSYKHLYSRTIGPAQGSFHGLHFAAHSHHPWPDATREAQTQYWDDSARWLDHKWDHVFGQVLHQAKQNIAALLKLDDPELICPATSTHEAFTRLFSVFEPGRPIKVLTTSSEFHSFSRQMRRFEERPEFEVTRVATTPFETFTNRFSAEAAKGGYDVVFLSQVFFDSGFEVRDLGTVIDAVPSKDTLIVIDGYHAFCAVPVSLAKYQSRIFYLAGGYKYAQSGEGCCFMIVPPGCQLRPANTGWMAHFESLHHAQGHTKGALVEYDKKGSRFAGATFDPSGWYRFNAVMKLWRDQGLDVDRIHFHVRSLQGMLLKGLSQRSTELLRREQIITPVDSDHYGHFLTFEVPHADAVVKRLAQKAVTVDSRGNNLRIGIGIYHDPVDIEQLLTLI